MMTFLETMGNSEIEGILSKKGIKPTANRILVFRTLLEAKGAMSIADIEQRLIPMDKASIFRVLTAFAKADAVHSFEDGSGSTKYELCHAKDWHHSADDMHAHFYCERCGVTLCLDAAPIPAIPLPDGATAHSVNYIVKGICPKCNARPT